MQRETFERVLAPAGQRLLAEIAAADPSESALAIGTRLRRTHDADLVAAATEQVRLRRKARAKFGDDAERMYFTAEALEQATRRAVADHRAQRARRHGVDSAIDLTCGIGGDLIALAHAGIGATGVDLDDVRTAIAAENLHALGLDGTVVRADATSYDRGGAGLSFVDPARRDGRGRRFDPRLCTPDWDFVAGLLNGPGAAKVAPGIAHELVPDAVEAEWVSDRGSLVEASLWGTPFASCRRRATVLPEGASLTDTDDPGPSATHGPGRYLYEPDDAVIRAHLVTAVAARVDGWLLDAKIAYVGSDDLVHTPFAVAYEVLDELPYREKALRQALRARDIGTLTVKKRGIDVVPEQLIGRLRLRGSQPATIVLCRVDGKGRALLVRRA